MNKHIDVFLFGFCALLLCSCSSSISKTSRAYKNKTYVVTLECTKDIARILSSDYDKSFNNKVDILYLQKFISGLIHSDITETDHFVLNMDIVKTYGIFSHDITPREAKFIISNSKSNLELDLVSYSGGRGSDWSLYMTNSVTAIKTYDLPKCSIK